MVARTTRAPLADESPDSLPGTDGALANRAVYAAGRETRRAILDAASHLFRERGLAGVSKAQIAAEAGVFPSQLGYYFGTKEALFVEAACRDVLHLATDVERAAARTRTPQTYIRALVRTALESPALLFFVEAVLLVRTRPELARRVTDVFDRLYGEGERANIETLARHGWRVRTSPAEEARGFWAAVLGLCLEQAAFGVEFSAESTETTVQMVLGLYEPAHDLGDPRA